MSRTTTIPLIFITLLLNASLARGQAGPRFLVSGGPLLREEGFHIRIGVASRFESHSSFSWIGEVQYNKVPHRIEHYDGGISEKSGREVIHTLLGLKVSGLHERRISPYGFAGIGWAWLWRDAEGSMEALSNSGLAFAFGGGLDFRLDSRASLFTEVLLVIHGSGEDFGGELPLTVGLAVSF